MPKIGDLVVFWPQSNLNNDLGDIGMEQELGDEKIKVAEIW